jgi:hypothetical protein
VLDGFLGTGHGVLRKQVVFLQFFFIEKGRRVKALDFAGEARTERSGVKPGDEPATVDTGKQIGSVFGQGIAYRRQGTHSGYDHSLVLHRNYTLASR